MSILFYNIKLLKNSYLNFLLSDNRSIKEKKEEDLCPNYMHT